MNVYALLLALLVLGASFVDGRDKEDARLFAILSTITNLSLTTTTTVYPYTCWTSINTATSCRRRRSLRKTPEDIQMLVLGEYLPIVDGSIQDNPVASSLSGMNAVEDVFMNAVEDVLPTEKARLAVTVWSSVTTTYTYIVTSTNTATTFSVSFACSAAGATYPNVCV